MSLVVTMKMQWQRAKTDLTKAQFEEDTAARQIEKLTSQINDVASAIGSSKDYKNNDIYKRLVAEQSAYEVRKESLDTEISMLKEQVQSYKEALKEGIKENTTWWCMS